MRWWGKADIIIFMARPLSNIKFAELLGITRQAVGAAIRSQSIHKGKAGIDPEHPLNVIYASRLETRRKANKKVKQSQIKNAEKKGVRRKKKKNKKVKEEIEASVWDIDDKKKIQETRLKQIQADKAAVEYAEKLKVLIDDKSLSILFGIFYDHLLNDLIYLPESIADIIVNEAKSAKDPVAAVADILKKSIKDIIKKGKRASKKMKPPKKGRKYILKKIKKARK